MYGDRRNWNINKNILHVYSKLVKQQAERRKEAHKKNWGQSIALKYAPKD